jgi:hypothetical protein
MTQTQSPHNQDPHIMIQRCASAAHAASHHVWASEHVQLEIYATCKPPVEQLNKQERTRNPGLVILKQPQQLHKQPAELAM